MSDLNSKKKAIIIEALLHDIGKVGQRARKKEELSKATTDREGDICPGDKYSTHLHVLWTDEFFSRYFTDEFKDKVIGEVAFDFNPQNLASFHHKPASSLQKLIQVADHISSGEREETERGDKDDYVKRRLASIFNKVALRGEPKIDEPYFYNLTQLNLSKDVFPKRKSELVQFSNYKIIGFKGIVEYRLGKEFTREEKRVINTLADFAFYAWVGYKTTMGMGLMVRL